MRDNPLCWEATESLHRLEYYAFSMMSGKSDMGHRSGISGVEKLKIENAYAKINTGCLYDNKEEV